LQLLFSKSEEGEGEGLALLEGEVLRLPQTVRTPHIGWNKLRMRRQNELLEGIDEDSFFYFAHSYYPQPMRREVVVAETFYGAAFPSVMADNAIYGTQFHPEKSSTPGAQILRNFARILRK
jgi:glutamine amidotransferase